MRGHVSDVTVILLANQRSPQLHIYWWCLLTAIFCSTSALSSIDYNDKNGMIKRKRNQKLLSTSTINDLITLRPVYNE